MRFPVATSAEAASRRTCVRARFRLAAGDRLALVLPPTGPEGGPLLAVWAALIAQKVRPELRAVVPGHGDEIERIRRLLDAVQTQRLIACVGDGLRVDELLAAADLALFTPGGPRRGPRRVSEPDTEALRRALESGLPVVASDVPVVQRAVQASGRHAPPDSVERPRPERVGRVWLGRPTPRWLAQRIVEALEILAADGSDDRRGGDGTESKAAERDRAPGR